MPNYRRVFIPGGQYFFTVNLKNRRSRLLTEHIDEFRQAYAKVQKQYPFETNAIVVLPDHLHAVWQLPETDSDYPIRWRMIKTHFTKALRAKGLESPIWQKRYWEHNIQDEDDLNNHIDYIYYNPIKHGHVDDVKDWPYSSWHRDDAIEKAELDKNRAKWDKINWGERWQQMKS